MGNRVYFKAKNDREEIFISEGNNAIPLFVHYLFQYTSEKELRENLETVEEEDHKNYILKIPKQNIKNNDTSLETFLNEKNEYKMIWSELLKVVEVLQDKGYVLELDVTEYTWFYEDEEWIKYFINITFSDLLHEDTMNKRAVVFSLIGDTFYDTQIYKKDSVYINSSIISETLRINYEENKSFMDRDFEKDKRSKSEKMKEFFSDLLCLIGCLTLAVGSVVAIIIDGFSALYIVGFLFFGLVGIPISFFKVKDHCGKEKQ